MLKSNFVETSQANTPSSLSENKHFKHLRADWDIYYKYFEECWQIAIEVFVSSQTAWLLCPQNQQFDHFLFIQSILVPSKIVYSSLQMICLRKEIQYQDKKLFFLFLNSLTSSSTSWPNQKYIKSPINMDIAVITTLIIFELLVYFENDLRLVAIK